MSLYSIATASLTTNDDRRRRPAIDQGQIARALMLCLVATIAFVVIARQAHHDVRSHERSGVFSFSEN